MAESCLLAVLGGVLGLGLSWLFVSHGDPTNGLLPFFYIPADNMLIGLGISVALGVATGIAPALQAMRLRVADALRRMKPQISTFPISISNLKVSNLKSQFPAMRKIDMPALAWLLQVAAVTRFGLMSVPRRLGTVAATVIGIAGVVAVLVGILSMAVGFQTAMTASGSDDKAIILRSGADSEMVSGLDHEATRIIADAPGVARGSNGPLSSPELYVMINLPKRSTGTDANVPLRGVDPSALQVRGNIKILDGPDERVGAKTKSSPASARPRNLAGWKSAASSKWAGLNGRWSAFSPPAAARRNRKSGPTGKVLQAAFNRGDTYQSVYVKLNSAGAFQPFKDYLTSRSASQCEGGARIGVFRRALRNVDTIDQHPGRADRVAHGRRRGYSGR